MYVVAVLPKRVVWAPRLERAPRFATQKFHFIFLNYSSSILLLRWHIASFFSTLLCLLSVSAEPISQSRHQRPFSNLIIFEFLN